MEQMNRPSTVKELIDIEVAMNHAVIVAITDHRGIITYVNDQFCEISQYAREELLGKTHRILNSGFHPSTFFKQLWETIESGEIWTGDICNRAKDRSIYWVKTTIVPFLNDEGKPYQYIAVRTDVTAQKSIEKIQQLAYMDELTGLPNRRKLIELINDSIEYQKIPFSLIYVDIDDFKKVNEGFGRDIGDLFLLEVGRRLVKLKDHFSMEVFRLTGDEFMILAYEPLHRIEELVEGVKEAFLVIYQIEGQEFYSNPSIGVSSYPDHAMTSELLFEKASVAVSKAKERAGVVCTVYNDSMEEDQLELLLIEKKLRVAIEQEQLQLFYQPKIDIQTNQVVGMEALTRWIDEDLGFISPATFIPIAETRGFINDIGDWSIKQACYQIKEWNETFGTSYRVAVNISPTHFIQPNFFETVKATIEETGVNPKFIELEITEESMMESTEHSINVLNLLRAYGITLSIDDFGTGYSSFSFLKQFPIDALKIDQSFVRGMNQEDGSASIVAVMIQLGHALNLEVVVEGVENESELILLKQLGCDIVQGYYYSVPLPAKEFTKKIEQVCKKEQ